MYAVLSYTPDGEPHGWRWSRQEDNIKVNPKAQWCEDDCISLYWEGIQYLAVADKLPYKGNVTSIKRLDGGQPAGL